MGDTEDKLREEIERVDADLTSSLADMRRRAEEALTVCMQTAVQEAMRKRGDLILRLNSSASVLPGASQTTDHHPTHSATPEADGKPNEPEDRRTAREVILEMLKAAQGPVRGLALTAAVVREGLTKSAGEKVRRRLVAAGVIRTEGSGFVLVEQEAAAGGGEYG